MSTNGLAAGRHEDEETPLLNGSRKHLNASDLWSRLSRHMNAKVSRNWADLVLLFCYIITGLLDSSATLVWGSFVSMQTGNTIYLGLGLADPSSGIRWIKAIVSIVSFCAGSFFFARFHRRFVSNRRWVLVASYALQTALIFVAAVIVSFGKQSQDGLHWQVLVPLASVAFQSSGQAVTSRVLKFSGLTSVVLTSNYCDLFADANILSLSNVERNRRAAAPLLLLLGALFGGLWAKSPFEMRGALWTAVILKAIAVVAWMFWATEPDEEQEAA